MAIIYTDDTHYKNIADAIRAKNGTTTKYMPSDMSAAIEAIETTPVLQEKTVIPSTSAQNITPDTGYDGLSKVAVNAIPSTYVKPTSTKAATIYTPTTSNQTISAGTYCSGTQTIAGDADLVAENIKKDVEIFGVTGTYEGSGSGGASIDTCTVTIYAAYFTVNAITTNIFDSAIGTYYKDHIDGGTTLTIENVICGSIISFYAASAPIVQVNNCAFVGGISNYKIYTAPTVAGATGTINIYPAD